MVREYHYACGTEVRVGDHITHVGEPYIVEDIFPPDSELAIEMGWLEGGVMIATMINGELNGRFLFEPPDGEQGKISHSSDEGKQTYVSSGALSGLKNQTIALVSQAFSLG